MSHYCKICGRFKPNEAFSGKGHRAHVCSECKRVPIEKRQSIEQDDEIFGFLKQSYISAKNINRLMTLKSSGQPRVAELAAIVFEIAQVSPYKRQRLKILTRSRRDLLLKLEETGLIFAHHYY